MWWATLVSAEDLRSEMTGRALRYPLSVLLRCRLGRFSSTEPEEELVLLRECKLLGFFAFSFSRLESSICVSYGCLFGLKVACCGMPPNDAVISSGLVKLNNVLGSTPADVDAKEPGCELWPSPAVLVPKDAKGPADDMLC
jgi:hypothetical protein